MLYYQNMESFMNTEPSTGLELKLFDHATYVLLVSSYQNMGTFINSEPITGLDQKLFGLPRIMHLLSQTRPQSYCCSRCASVAL